MGIPGKGHKDIAANQQPRRHQIGIHSTDLANTTAAWGMIMRLATPLNNIRSQQERSAIAQIIDSAASINNVVNTKMSGYATLTQPMRLFLPLVVNINSFGIRFAYFSFFYIKKIYSSNKLAQLHVPIITRIKIR